MINYTTTVVVVTVVVCAMLFRLYLWTRDDEYSDRSEQKTNKAIRKINAYKRMDSDFKVVGDFAKFIVDLDGETHSPRFTIVVQSVYDDYSYGIEDENVMDLEITDLGRIDYIKYGRTLSSLALKVDDKVEYLLRVKETMKKKTGGEL